MDLARTAEDVVRTLVRRGALGDTSWAGAVRPLPGECRAGADVLVILDGNVPGLCRALVGEAASLASRGGGRLIAYSDPVADASSLAELGAWGVDQLVVAGEPRLSSALVTWMAEHPVSAIFAPATAHARAIAQHASEYLGYNSGVLPTSSMLFSSHASVQVLTAQPTPVVTIRAGLVPLREPRDPIAPEIVTTSGEPPVLVPPLVDPAYVRLADAPVALCVGAGVDPADYPLIDDACRRLGAAMCATRKVTDRGWLPRSLHVGSSGRTIAPRLYLLVGASGHPHHRVGVEAAGTICALNDDPTAPVWSFADTGLLGDWRESLGSLCDEIGAVVGAVG